MKYWGINQMNHSDESDGYKHVKAEIFVGYDSLI